MQRALEPRDTRVTDAPNARTQGRVNAFAFKLANVNGTGSASANGLLMQAIFRMGIAVSGTNLFPSNIQGLPTWYEIRVDKDGHTARTSVYDLIVAMNAETYARDVQEVRSGGWVVYDSSWPLASSLLRADVTFLGVPFAKLCNDAFAASRERTLMKNIAYAGTLAALLDIDMGVVAEMLNETFGRKPALMSSNETAIQLGYDHAKQNFACPLPIRLEKMRANDDKILIDGNTATALGAVYAGATVAAWYPITPSTSVLDAFKSFCEAHRTDKATGERRYCILQAEDELAAVGMAIGAAWMGARAFTSTAGPGISLMNELIGLAYYAEIPVVIVDVQRVGPSTGMPTRTQQGDILLCAYASHGDTKHILLFPANPGECFQLAVKAFDLAERFQTPVFLLTDLDIGMNDWVVPRLEWDDAYRPDRGRVLSRSDLEALPKYHRYSPEDELGVAARSLPGVHEKGAFFTRGSGHNKLGGYTEIPDEYQEVMDRLTRKHRAARNLVPEAVVERRRKASFGVVTVGGVRSRGPGGARGARTKRRPRRLPPRARLSVRRRSGGVPARAPPRLRGGAEPRRAAPVAPRPRDGGAEGEAPIRPRLRRIPAPGAPGRDRDRVTAPGAGARGGGARMSFIKKPVARHPSLKPNKLGLTVRDYEGSMSTLCAGCGHDSITAAIVRAFYELDTPPHMIAKLSGIGCSSKTPTYFVSGAHGFNSAHGRMPAIATGAAAANRDLVYVGVSGDGDSLSIGLGHLCHAIRRNVNMLYLIENNGCYGLTKGQFSASTDIGSKSKRGEPNTQPPIDPVMLALSIGATFVARSFSGDKAQLVPILKAGIAHRGFALVDVISPCVTFNDHEGSTKSYVHTRKHQLPVIAADFVPHAREITTSYEAGEAADVVLHDGSTLRLRKVAPDYDPTDRARVWSYLQERQRSGEIPMGLLFLDEKGVEMHAAARTVRRPLAQLPYEELCPGSAALQKLQNAFR